KPLERGRLAPDERDQGLTKAGETGRLRLGAEQGQSRQQVFEPAGRVRLPPQALDLEPGISRDSARDRPPPQASRGSLPVPPPAAPSVPARPVPRALASRKAPLTGLPVVARSPFAGAIRPPSAD